MAAARMRLNKETRGQGETVSFPRLLAGRLCLDFANTIEGPISPEPEDFLGGYDDLVGWSHHVRVVDEGGAARLRALAGESPARARQVFARALALRESIDRVFRRAASGKKPPSADLQLIQSEHLGALHAASLDRFGARFAWTWPAVDDLETPLWPVVESAIELLTDGDLTRVKQCPGANDCGWLFYDASRNSTRRWCSMEGCGSRVKMRRSYARRRSSGAEPIR